MKIHHPENVRIKRQYVDYLREAKRYSEQSIDKVEAALHRFESYTRFKPFRAFRIEQAKAFKQHLAKEVSADTGKPLGASTIHATLIALKQFFTWLAGQPGFRSKISYGDADYFNPSGATSRIARAERPRPVPTLEQIRHVLRAMPAKTDIEKRNRALIACAILTGARDGALASLRLKHVDLEGRSIYQDAREVRTKNSKTFTTWFFPVGREIELIVIDWVRYLREEKLWGLDDPLFPATRIQLGPSHHYEAAGLEPVFS